MAGRHELPTDASSQIGSDARLGRIARVENEIGHHIGVHSGKDCNNVVD
jgi:hypothetical protein